jgi:transposase InsO family protein
METEATPTPAPAPKKPGRPPLSPNGLDKEFRQADERRHAARRKAKASRRRTVAGKRQADRLRRAQRKHLRRLRLCEPTGETVRRRLKAVRYYDHWRGHDLTEEAAAQRSAQHYGVSAETIRRWARLYRTGGPAALLPKPPGPAQGEYKVSVPTQLLIVALRRLLGWHEKRIAVELAQRGLAQVSHTTVGRIFARYHLPTRTYCSCAQREGLRYRCYEKASPNQQWHIDFTETHLADGSRLVVVVLIDDHSRYCLRCRVVPDMTAEVAIQIVQEAWQEFGVPAELVSDNGRAFASGYEDVPTLFGQTLRDKGIQHILTRPYYPEGNGKAEAFIKILERECLNRPFATVAELEQALAQFVTYYNHVRLHGSLGYQPPATRYVGSVAPVQHGLAGIPDLPAELAAAYPPTQPIHIPLVNAATVKRRFALVPVGC